MRPTSIFKSLSISSALCLTALPTLASETGDQLHQLEHFFESANTVAAPKIVDCTLSGGTKTQCFQITVKPEPTNYVPGPWCPTNVDDGPEMSGIWLKDGVVYDADGAFFSDLATLYNDQKWSMIQDDGSINATLTKEQCEAAANPNVGDEYQNWCVQCLPEHVDSALTLTYTIPLTSTDLPEPADNRRVGSGIAANGVRLDAPAPVDAITGAYTIAPFDDCGGHINVHVGYHYHAVTSCQEEAGSKADTAIQVGIAMDGYPIMANKNADGTEPEGLDACNGHVGENGSYHYHAGNAGSNAIIGCLKAEYGCVGTDAGAVCDASQSVRRGPPPGANGERPPQPRE